MSNTKHTRRGDFGAIEHGSHVHTYEISGAIKRESTITSGNPFAGRTDQPMRVGNYEIVPRGETNNLPIELRDLLEKNHIGHNVLTQLLFLLVGNGAALYEIEYIKGQKTRKYVEDKAILAWLQSWEYEDYLERCATDYFATQGCFTEFIRNKGGRIAQGKITRLKHVGTETACLEWPDSNDEIKRIITGPWDKPYLKKFRPYPLFTKASALKHRRSIAYHHFYSFARTHYSVPGFMGAINWIKRSSDIPIVLESLTNNSLNIKWHIKSPMIYWEKKAEALRAQCTEKNLVYKEKMLEDLKDAMFSDLSEMLTGVDNVGKFFTSESVVNEYGKLEGWEVIPIDMKVKDFISAQLEIAKHSDLSVATGMGLSPSLSNLVIDGNLSSGSDKLYALKLHMATNTFIPERIICKALNDAIQVNFPGTKVRIGFAREIVKPEEAETPAKRTKENA